ncbi:MAG: hypothetical protein MUF64_26395 [Polyangiaceae bacterium]|nr:hypothetical protein [Polyangiaceae bacterium]
MLTVKDATLRNLHIQGDQVGLRILGGTGLLEQSWIAIDSSSTKVSTVAVDINEGEPKLQENCIQGGGGFSDSVSQLASAGVRIQGGSKALLRKNILQGGMGNAGVEGHGSAAVFAINSSPILDENEIDGGNGTTVKSNQTGSIGVFLTVDTDDGAPKLLGNKIHGGRGKAQAQGGLGSIGVLATASSGKKLEATVEKNSIQGGQGDAPQGFTSYGVSALNVSVNLRENFISGGEQGAAGKDIWSVAVSLAQCSGVEVSRNSLLGARGDYKQSAAIFVTRGQDPTRIDNNMLHGGALSPDGAETSVIRWTADSRLIVRHNTIAMGNGKTSWGLDQLKGNDKNSIASVVVNNLIVGPDSQEKSAFRTELCARDVFSELSGNALIHLSGNAFEEPGNINSTCNALVSGLPSLVANLRLSCGANESCKANYTANAELVESCSGAGDEHVACKSLGSACSSQATCAGALFSSWDASSAGTKDLRDESNPGWKIRESVSCNTLRSSYSSMLEDDRFSAEVRKTNTPVRGAHEACNP